MVFGICLKVIGILLWLVQAGYSATQGIYRYTYTNSLHTASFLLRNKFCRLIEKAVEHLLDTQCVIYSDVTL